MLSLAHEPYFRSTADLTTHLSVPTARLKGRMTATTAARAVFNHIRERGLTESKQGKE